MAQWIKQNPIWNQGGWRGKPLYKDRNTVIIPVGRAFKKVVTSLLEYNTTNDKITELVTFNESPLNCSPDAACIDNKNDMIYIPGYNSSDIYKIDLNTYQVQTLSLKDQGALSIEVVDSMIIDNKLHIIGDYEMNNEYCTGHIVYDITNTKIQSAENISFPQGIDCIESLVYLPSQMKAIFFGSGDFDKNFVSYDINNGQCVVLNNFNLRKDSDDPSVFILTKDEKYLIVVMAEYEDEIVAFDLNANTQKNCNIDLPLIHDYRLHSFIVDDLDISNVIINGYLRQFEEFKKFPDELVDIIIGFYSKQYIHLYEKISQRHWKIELIHILDSMENVS